MERTVGFSPSSRELKQKLPVPIGMIFSPTKESNELITAEYGKLSRCSRCQSFLSSGFELNENKWICGICGNKNEVVDHDVALLQAQKQSFDLIISKVDNCSTISVVYLSRDLKELDFLRAKVFVYGLLRNLQDDQKCIIMIGSDSPAFSILKVKANEAEIVNGASIKILVEKDLNDYCFNRQNEFAAERAIDKLTVAKESNPHWNCFYKAQMLSAYLQNSIPIRVIGIIKKVKSRRVDAELLWKCMCRIDVVAVKSSPYTADFINVLPGSFLFLSNRNPLLQGKHLILQDTLYQYVLKHQSRYCQVDVLKSPRPASQHGDNMAFFPVIPGMFPIAVELSPVAGTNCPKVQFVSKFVCVRNNTRFFILRVHNSEWQRTDNIDEYLLSVDWNAVLWFWFRKIIAIKKLEFVSLIWNKVAVLLKEIGDKIPEDFIKAVCAIPKADVLNRCEERSMRAYEMILFAPPSCVPMIPQFYEDGMICAWMNGVYEIREEKESGPSDTAHKVQMALPVYTPIPGVIPEDLIRVNEAAKSTLTHL